VSSVKAPAFVPVELVARFSAAAAVQGFRVETFGTVEACPLIALTRWTAGPRPRIYLSAGIHGDEPLVCPLLNPAGFHRGVRENADAVDLNRDYRQTRSAEIAAHIRWLARQPNFDLAICLHEDWEAKGFYLYELNPLNQLTKAEPMIEAVRSICPIDVSETIDERPALAGILRPEINPAERELWPEALYLQVHHTKLGYTLETPSGFPLAQRIAALRAAVTTAVRLTLG
jgi:hypothetical protein